MAKSTDDPNKPDHDTASSSMSDDEHLEQLAARFLELWREQVAATADGAHAASAIGRLYASLGADTTRMGEGFEAWGNLIGHMAMGQNPAVNVASAANPMGGAMSAANPLMAMMEQMTKAAKDLPTQPFASPPFGGQMPFPPNMAAMAGMTGMGMPGAKPTATATATAPDSHDGSDQTEAPQSAPEPSEDTAKPKTAQKTTAAKNAAKGQGKNDQSKQPEAASAKTRKPKAGGAKAASDAHGSRDDELAQLARRIADLSETIAALEAGAEGTGGKPPKGD